MRVQLAATFHRGRRAVSISPEAVSRAGPAIAAVLCKILRGTLPFDFRQAAVQRAHVLLAVRFVRRQPAPSATVLRLLSLFPASL